LLPGEGEDDGWRRYGGGELWWCSVASISYVKSIGKGIKGSARRRGEEEYQIRVAVYLGLAGICEEQWRGCGALTGDLGQPGGSLVVLIEGNQRGD
jgi:hypothetical protein